MRKFFTSTIFLAIVACILWASPFVPLKIGLELFPYPIQFGSYRFILAGFFIAVFLAPGKGYWLQVKKNWKYILTLSVFNTSLLYSCFYIGASMTPASMAAMVVGSQPLFIALMAHFLSRGDRMTWLKAGSIALGLAGLTIVSWDKISLAEAFSAATFIGMLFLIGQNLCSAYSNVLISRNENRIHPSVLSSSQLMIGGVTMLVFGFSMEGIQAPPLSWEFAACMAALVFISTVAIGIWYVIVSRPGVKISELSMWKFLIPVIGSVESWILIPTDKPNGVAIIGLTVITSSLVLLYLGYFLKLFSKKKK